MMESKAQSKNESSLTMFAILLLFVGLQICSSIAVEETSEMPLLMPNIRPTVNESYFCTAFRMPSKEHKYIVGFDPKASKHTAHHILIYGCYLPGYFERDTQRVVWDCGEMAGSQNSGIVQADVCKSGSEIIYAWAMDAPALTLPPGVGFKVGGATNINYLVLQVHYANVNPFLNNMRDNSGVSLRMLDGSSPSVNKLAGVFLLGTRGTIPPRSIEHMEAACHIDEPIELHPFAFRVHTHKLGTAVSGWKINNGNWELIGRHNPQEPQMFYEVEKTATVIRQGDTLAARCTMKNYLSHQVGIGSTGNDEMCNFYLMFYVEGDEMLQERTCFTPGPPNYYWKYDPNVNQPPEYVDMRASNLSIT